jgi:hypothetical protein
MHRNRASIGARGNMTNPIDTIPEKSLIDSPNLLSLAPNPYLYLLWDRMFLDEEETNFFTFAMEFISLISLMELEIS